LSKRLKIEVKLPSEDKTGEVQNKLDKVQTIKTFRNVVVANQKRQSIRKEPASSALNSGRPSLLP
jgi:hypothetical protein